MLIQLSDVFLGIQRMFFRYIEESEPTTILLDIVDLDSEEKEILGQLKAVMLKSIDENVIFKHGSASEEFERKLNIFFDYPYLQLFFNQEEEI